MTKYLFLLVLGLKALVASQVTVADTLATAIGTAAGSITRMAISWSTFVTSAGATVPAGTTTVHISNGQFTVNLEDGYSTTPQVFYQVEYFSLTNEVAAQIWRVPNTTGPVKISDCAQLVSLLAAGFSLLGSPSDNQYIKWNASAKAWVLVTFTDQESLTGALDGVNTVFTLASAPDPPLGLVLFRNGVAQKNGSDYTLTGHTITFVTAATPQPDDTLLAWYRY